MLRCLGPLPMGRGWRCYRFEATRKCALGYTIDDSHALVHTNYPMFTAAILRCGHVMVRSGRWVVIMIDRALLSNRAIMSSCQ
jgi:hypothetical protein